MRKSLGLVLSIGVVAAIGCTKSDNIASPEPAKKGATPGDSSYDAPAAGDAPVLVDKRGRSEAALPGDQTQPGAVADQDPTEPGSASQIKIDGGRSEPVASQPTADGASGITYKTFTGQLTEAQIQQWVEADKAKRGADAARYRYAYIPAEFLRDKKEANYARVGLAKGVNSVAYNAEDIVKLEDVSDGHGIVYAIDIRAIWGDSAERKWDVVANARQRRVFSPAPTLDLRAFPGGPNAPVSADRLVYNLLHGAIYNQLVEMPGQGTQLYQRLNAREVTARYAVQNAITYGPRYIQRREIPGYPGGLWESFDDFNGRRREIPWISGNPIPRFRGDGMVADYGTVASETWYHMKNGLPAYIIWGNANQERTKAEQSFVRDPLNHKGGDLVNGFCIFCHISGIQAAPNDMWTAIEQGRVRDAERARQFWTSNEELSKQYARDRQIVVDALKKIVLSISDGEPEFNRALYNGADEREPCFFLVSTITGSRLRGDTAGLRRRDANGQIGANRNGSSGSRGGFGGGGSFGLLPDSH